MSGIDGVVRVDEASTLLGVTVRRVEQLAASGEVTRVAHGLIDLASIHHYLAARGGTSNRRAWSEHTAWAAIALLSDVDVDWLGGTQRSRLRAALREIDSLDLVRRARNRATVLRYSGHTSAAARLRKELLRTDHTRLGLVTVDDRDGADGYLAAAAVDRIVDTHALRSDAAGSYVLRATTFDLDVVATLAATSDTLLATDAATSLDPRERSRGHQLLTERLDDFRG
jgi:hypothetical protein